MRTTTERYIDASNSTIAKLAKVFNVTPKFVYLSLTYRKNSEKACKIRYTAVKNYDAKPMRHCPECETIFLSTENGRQVMRQMFDNGAVLTVDRESGDTAVRDRHDKLVGSWPNVSLAKLTEIQLFAECI